MPDPPPPQITISDPNDPREPQDVLGSGSERAPWRPSRRTKQVAAVTFLVAAVVAVPTLVVAHQREQDRLDRVAGEQVRLTAPVDQAFSATIEQATDVPLSLYNDGPDRVVVVSAHIDREGYPTQRTSVEIGSRATGEVRVQLPSPCPEEISTFSTPKRIVLRVRTARGTVVTKTVRVGDGFGYGYQETLRRSCGVLDPSEALTASARVARRTGRTLELTVRLSNTATTSYRVTRLISLQGLTFSDGLPVEVPASGSTGSFTVRATIPDCRSVRRLEQPVTSSYYTPTLGITTDRGVAFVTVEGETMHELDAFVDAVCPRK